MLSTLVLRNTENCPSKSQQESPEQHPQTLTAAYGCQGLVSIMRGGRGREVGERKGGRGKGGERREGKRKEKSRREREERRGREGKGKRDVEGVEREEGEKERGRKPD